MVTTLFICGILTAAILATFVLAIIQSDKCTKMNKYLYTDWEDDAYAVEVWSTPSGKHKYYKFVKKEK